MRILLLILIFLYSGSAFASKNQKEKTSEKIMVKIAKAKFFTFHDKFTSVGRCQSKISRDYYAQAAGRVDFTLPSTNDIISKGTLILSIDQDVARAMKERNDAARNSAALAFKRKQELFDKNILSKENFEKSKVVYQDAMLSYSKNLKDYENLIFTAPFDGRIGLLQVNVGDNVKAGDLLFSITASGNDYVTYELPENLINLVSEKTEVNIIDGDIKIKGQVDGVSNYLSQNHMISARVTANDTKLMHGSYAEAEFIINKHEAIGINDQAVMKNDQGNFIYKIIDNKVKQSYVQLGSRLDEIVEIISEDIKDGDRVVLEGLTKIRDGVEVEIVE